MSGIIKINGVWRSEKVEMDARKCHLNMTNRLPVLSSSSVYSECCPEWTCITGHKDAETDENGKTLRSGICLCGMRIGREFYFMNDVSKNICVMGEVCCKRQNSTAFRKYIESLKKKGHCWVCNTKHQDLGTHYSSISHNVKQIEYLNNFKEVLKKLLQKEYKKFIENEKKLELLKTHRICVGCSSLISKEEPNWKVRCLKCYKKHTKNRK